MTSRLRRGAEAARQALFGRAPKTQPGQFNAQRARLVQLGTAALFAVIAARAVMLSLFPAASESLHTIADNQYRREIELAPYRGAVFDRRGEPLAISIRRPSLAVNPRVFDPSDAEVRRLAKLLAMPQGKIKKIAERKNYFAWLARQLDHRVADEVQNLGLDGLVQIREPARFYPAGGAAAHLLGFMGVENQGMAGLERLFDKDLRGQSSKVMAARDARGQLLFNETTGAAPLKQGHSIHLTLDRVIQEIAEDELEAGVRKARATKGFAIVSDPHTGRILAIANYPPFDPNNTKRLDVKLTRNHALADVFEPGSVVKPFIVAKALEAGKTTLGESHETGASIRVGRNAVRDDHPAPRLSTTDVIVRSSNIGTYKIAQRMGKDRTYDALKAFGFADPAGMLGLPGESAGRLVAPRTWSQIQFATIVFGYGLQVTGLELVQAMGAIANGGNLMKATLVDRVVSADGVVVESTPTQALGRAVSPEVARLMRGVMRQVVTDQHGTAHLAATKLYTTAGKTGTAKKYDPAGGYSKDKRIASMIGFAPVEDPHLVVYVLIDEPREKPYYGGLRAAPVFSGIIERSLKYLNVAPDIEPPPAVAAGAAKDGEETRKL